MNRILKARIIEKYGTQADFSQAVKTDETVISRVVRGRRQLDNEAQKKWADALECEAQELFVNGVDAKRLSASPKDYPLRGKVSNHEPFHED